MRRPQTVLWIEAYTLTTLLCVEGGTPSPPPTTPPTPLRPGWASGGARGPSSCSTTPLEQGGVTWQREHKHKPQQTTAEGSAGPDQGALCFESNQQDRILASQQRSIDSIGCVECRVTFAVRVVDWPIHQRANEGIHCPADCAGRAREHCRWCPAVVPGRSEGQYHVTSRRVSCGRRDGGE
jgi:hypothetical protein